MNTNTFANYLLHHINAKYTERGIYVRYERPSSIQLTQLISLALESSTNTLLSGPDDMDECGITQDFTRLSPFVWRINASSIPALMIAKWLYTGNWCLFINADATRTCLSFEYRHIEKVIDTLFESVSATGGIVAFHDNTTIWAYASRVTPKPNTEPTVQKFEIT
ncbi:MAG: hypothetical protein SFY80_05910 [Verrucomicrobiota bacterium]|nr:hypothetical protein [Verrucomicrobiota bacterium]